MRAGHYRLQGGQLLPFPMPTGIPGQKAATLKSHSNGTLPALPDSRLVSADLFRCRVSASHHVCARGGVELWPGRDGKSKATLSTAEAWRGTRRTRAVSSYPPCARVTKCLKSEICAGALSTISTASSRPSGVNGLGRNLSPRSSTLTRTISWSVKPDMNSTF